MTALLAPWLLFVVASAGHAVAQNKEPSRKEREAATQAFLQCVEMEKVGDATACWKLWLTKHENTGSVAEVMFARERASHVAQGSGGVPQAPGADTAAQPPSAQPAPAGSSAADQIATAEFDKELAAAMSDSAESSVEQPKIEPPPEPAPPPAPAKAAPPQGKVSPAGTIEKPNEPTPIAARGEPSAKPERRSLGLSIQPQLTIAAAFNNFGHTNMTRADGSTEFGLKVPSFLVGGGLAVGYDLSQALKSRDTHVRASCSYLHGTNGVEMSANVMPIDLSLEKGFDVRPRLLWYVAAGWTGTIINAKVLASPSGVGPTGKLSSFAWGGVLRSGIDFYMTPHFSLRAELFTRLNLVGGKYKASQKDPMLADLDRRQDFFNEFGLNLGVNWML